MRATLQTCSNDAHRVGHEFRVVIRRPIYSNLVEQHGVLLLGFRLQGLIGLDAHEAIDVPRLSGSASWMDKKDRVLHVLPR